jgi:hypothetical protein
VTLHNLKTLCESRQISCSALYEIITSSKKIQKCSRVCTECREWPQLWLFLEGYHKECNYFSQSRHVTSDETLLSFLNAETKEQPKHKRYTHSSNKPKKFKQTSACQKADGNCFLRQKRSADGGIHATRDHNNITSVLWNTKKLYRAIQNTRCRMLTSSVVLFHNNLRLHIAAHIRALLEYFNWELLDHHPHNPDLAPSNHHLFTYPKK